MKKILSSLLAFAMMLAMFSGVVIFNASADGEEVQMHIPFINQYTLEQAQKMGKTNGWAGSGNYVNSSNYSFAKDDQGRTVITLTTPEGLSPEWHVCNGYLSTGTNATPYVKDTLIDGINIFGDAELSNKTKIAFKFDGDDNFKSSFNGANLMFNSGTERVCLSLQGPVKSNGYLIYDFSKIKPNSYDESGITTMADAFDGRISSLNFALIFKTTNTTVTFWIDDVYLVGAADTVDLHRAIREGKAAGLTGSVITNAENVYKDTASTQEQIDAAAAAIDAALDEIKYGYQKAKQDLDALLTTASDLGFFDSGYEHYQVVSDADMAYSDPASTLDVLRYYIGVVRMLVAGELVENNDLYDALARCSNVWRYNYTDKSYKDLLAAIDEAWAIIESDAAGAIAILDAAYDALEALPTKSTTADFFDGWTTAQVNDVVSANPTKIDDYILGGNCDFSDDTAFEADGNFSMT
ncbi:MAG: hypothetical protein IJL83_07820, partial [Clostridia bacterium]|nr:hypothetical protein [Clostridia bacterium]